MILYDYKGHMVSDKSLDELHQFARQMGLRRDWFQNHPVHPHYDLTTPRAIERARSLGARKVTPKEIIIASRKISAKPNRPLLTRSEWEVAKLLMQGFSRHGIAELRSITPASTATHVNSIYEKLGIKGLGKDYNTAIVCVNRLKELLTEEEKTLCN